MKARALRESRRFTLSLDMVTRLAFTVGVLLGLLIGLMALAGIAIEEIIGT